MKGSMTRILAGLMAAVISWSVLPAGAVELPGGEEPVTEAVELPAQAALGEIDMGAPTTWPTSGTLEGGFTWGMLTEDPDNYVLTIRGDGPLPDFGKYDQKPWHPWRVDTIRLYGDITAIGAYNFNFGFRHIVLPAALEKIGPYAMENAVLTGVSVPYGVTEIGEGAFSGADLKWVSIPDTVTVIGKYAFAQTRLRYVALPDSVTTLGEGAFQGTELRNFRLPIGLKEIPDYCFNAVAELTEWTVPPGVSAIGANAFAGTGLKELYLPETVTELGANAFANSALETVTIAADLRELPQSCFKGCKSLKWVDIQSDVTAIPKDFFYQCEGLEGVVLPETMERVHNTGFYQNGALTGIFARGPGVTRAEENAGTEDTIFWSGRAADTPPTVYYLPDQTGWAGLEGEGCSDTRWYGHPLDTWDGENADLPDSAVMDYYSPTAERFFCMSVPGDSYPRTTGFTIQVGDEHYNTGASDRITIPIPGDFAGDVIISKEGYITHHQPAELLATYNWITIWPDDGGTTPVIRSIYMDNSSGGYRSYGNLKSSDFTLYELNETSRRFYADVLWRDGVEGTIALVQGDTRVELTNNGWTGCQPGVLFTAEGGDIYLQAVNKNGGVSSKLKLKMRAPTKEGDVDFGEEVSGVTDDSCEAMQNSQLKLDINGDMLPMSITLDRGKVEGVIGITVAQEQKGAAFKRVKNELDRMEDKVILDQPAQNKGMFPKARDILGKNKSGESLWPEKQAHVGAKGQIQFLGYFEGKYVQGDDGSYRFQMGMSKLAVKLEGSTKYDQQTVIGYIPVYWELELKAMLEMFMQMYQGETMEHYQIPPLQMNVELALGGEVGAGIQDVVTAGVRAEGKFLAQIYVPVDTEHLTMSLNGDVYIRVTLADLSADVGKGLLHGEHILYQNGVWNPGSAARARTARILEENLEFAKVSRDYLVQGTEFVANRAAGTRAIQPAAGKVSSTAIMANNYPGADPQLLTLGKDQLLVWLEDDGTPDQGTALYYSVYQSGKKKWTDPARVDGEGASAMAPELKLVDGAAYLLWMRRDGSVSPDSTDLREISAALDVAVARFDPDTLTFGPAAILGTAGSMDILPEIVSYGEQLAVFWINSEGYLLGMDGCDLWMALWDGENWVQSKVYAGLKDVDSLCAAPYYGTLGVHFSQSGGEGSALADKEIYTLRYLPGEGGFTQLGEMVRRTDNDAADTGVLELGEELYWYREGRLVNDGGVSLNVGGSGSRVQYIADDNGVPTLVYAVTRSDDAVDFYTLLDDGTGWGEPVLAASSTGWVENWSAQYDAKDNLTIAAEEREPDLEGGTPFGTANLTVYTITPQKDLALTEVDYDPYTLVPGKELTVFATLENPGMETAAGTITGAFDGGSAAGTLRVEDIRPGERREVAFTCTVPQGGAGELSLKLSATGDKNTDNNALTCTLAAQDLSVEGVELALDFDGRGTAAVSVVNRGATLSGAARLELKRARPVTGLDSDPEWETLAESQIIQPLEPGHMAQYTFQLSGVAEGEMIYALMTTQDPDNLGENDRNFAVAALPAAGGLELGDCRVLGREGDSLRIQIAADNGRGEPVSGTVCAAAYDGEKMTDAAVLALRAAPGECLLEQVTLTCPKSGEVRVFVLGEDTLAPMGDAVVLKP